MATLQSLTITTEAPIKLPVGSNNQRPISPENGMIRFNTFSQVYEYYEGGRWSIFNVGNIPTDGLVLWMDADKYNLPPSLDTNYLNNTSWLVGTGSAAGFTQNGLTQENNRIISTDPFGNRAVVWETRPTGANDDDGGWNTTPFNVDETKQYQFSVWVKRITSTSSGNFYQGLYGINSSGSYIGVEHLSDNATNGNPYWDCPGIGALPLNEWVLVVGNVYPAGTTFTGKSTTTGRWNTAGVKIAEVGCNIGSGDVKWKSGTTQAVHRTYHYYSTTTAAQLQFAYPRVDIVDGNQPTIAQLVKNNPNVLRTVDQSLYLTNGTLINNPSYSNGYFTFNGVNTYIDFGNPASLSSIGGTNNITSAVWVYFNAYGGGGQNYAVVTVKGPPWTWLIENPSNTLRFRITAGGSDVSIADTSTHNLNQWYHVVGTYDGATMKIYVNGELKNSRSQVGTLASNSVTAKLGTYEGTNYNLNGRVAGCQIYKKTLTEGKIRELFESQRNRFGV